MALTILEREDTERRPPLPQTPSPLPADSDTCAGCKNQKDKVDEEVSQKENREKKGIQKLTGSPDCADTQVSLKIFRQKQP